MFDIERKSSFAGMNIKAIAKNCNKEFTLTVINIANHFVSLQNLLHFCQP
jgi:hypothetical protein